MSAIEPASEAWSPSPNANRVLQFFQMVLLAVGVGAMLIGCSAVAGVWIPRSLEILAVCLLPAMLLATLAVHEYGHLLAARGMGMTVYMMKIGPLQMLARRRGWRVRWQRGRSGYAGYVMALINPYAALRPQYAVLSAGGPAANLLVALLTGALALHLGVQARMGAFCVGFAVLNLAVGLANLIPTRTAIGPNDGLYLLGLSRRLDADRPELVLAQLNGLSCKGITADNLPAERVALLAQGDWWLFHSWFVLKAAQNRCQWRHAAALEVAVADQIAALPEHSAAHFSQLIAILQCELSFSRAMAGETDAAPLDATLTAEIDWSIPSLRMRCQALMAVQRGEDASALRLLDQAQECAQGELDPSLRISEGILLEAVRQRIRSDPSRSAP
ncbi:M50 family metallopeptidase [Xanthomonas sp. SI]|uniref:M50 family metallopeptidase n=1 Tax=Xanthomonas sp. SI TaxID=2724123 RepID=UPI00163952B3|nr:M50 family metallopeptidase [Xanthomonas sp. SI]